tara:strand:+ start:505 stop:774 length:270 start_codon:yes stop_codon:yes gene_type:complete
VELYKTLITLGAGDILHDPVTKETGLLVGKINLFNSSYIIEHNLPNIIAWEIWWCGTYMAETTTRTQVYTENGIINMIREGVLVHYKNN